VKDCIPWERPHTGAQEKHEDKGPVNTKCYKLTTASIPYCPMLLGAGRRQRAGNGGVKLSLEKRGNRGEGVISFVFITILFCF